ncbi:TPA: DUF551 domain-containing protein [Escherichia coli]|nr:DUF551 domain-containing protein [Escherichia coli]EFM2128268.1 DUF551 domain-containing protein [Escherichia coli]EGK5915228.1 DUF551 domain-containing protein [Escherichia coli]HCP7627783.1 DUF551 domain-containing protein [Escherichia coli]HDH9050155.1 DUF551 domain-containing protein [Escherichia coli]
MTTITKERLLTIKQWRETYGHSSNVVLPAEEAEELARIALASLEEEPVAYIFKHPAGKLFWALTDESNKEQPDVIPVYAAAPASVVPDNASEPLAYAYKELTPEIMRNHLAVFERYGIAPNDSSTTIHALRIALDGIERSAAMLHGAEPVSQTYKLPVNTPCQDAPAHIWLQTAGVWPEDGELSELTWCSHNQHHDGTLYVRADLVNGNSPVTPDGWISCSDRMPEDTKMLLAFSQGEIVAAYWNWVVNPIDYKKYRAFTYLSGYILDDVTHWMPLPEPPL